MHFKTISIARVYIHTIGKGFAACFYLFVKKVKAEIKKYVHISPKTLNMLLQSGILTVQKEPYAQILKK